MTRLRKQSRVESNTVHAYATKCDPCPSVSVECPKACAGATSGSTYTRGYTRNSYSYKYGLNYPGK